LLPFVEAIPKVSKYQPGMDAHAFSWKIGFELVAGAWEAITARKGLVLVQNSDSSSNQFYPRPVAQKTMRQYGSNRTASADSIG